LGVLSSAEKEEWKQDRNEFREGLENSKMQIQYNCRVAVLVTLSLLWFLLAAIL